MIDPLKHASIFEILSVLVLYLLENLYSILDFSSQQKVKMLSIMIEDFQTLFQAVEKLLRVCSRQHNWKIQAVQNSQK